VQPKSGFASVWLRRTAVAAGMVVMLSLACSPGLSSAASLGLFVVRVVAASHASTLSLRAATALTWVSDSTVALLDVDDGQVVLQPLYAGAERRLGRKGNGPGEFRLPVAMLAGPDRELVVADGLAQRLTRFDRTFNYAGSQPLPGMPLHLLRRTGDHLLVLWIRFGESGPEIGDVDLVSGRISRVWHPFQISTELSRGAEGVAGPSPFVAAIVDGRGRLVIGGGTSYRLFRFTEAGVLSGSFGRDAAPEEYSRAERAELERGMTQVTRGRGGAAQNEALQALFARPKPFFGANALASDDRGNVWVATSRRTAAGSMLDVFRDDGSWIGTVSVRDDVVSLAAHGSSVAVLVKRRSGEHEGEFGVDVYHVNGG
jgi:hypothetical protein